MLANENDGKKGWLFEDRLTLELIDGPRFLLVVWKQNTAKWFKTAK